jgi:hypothetical protein
MIILAILALVGVGMASTVSSRATAQANDGFQMQATSTSTNVVVTVLELPLIRSTLTVSPMTGYAGNVFEYNYTVKNIGNVTVYNLTDHDLHFNDYITFPKNTLLPGESTSMIVPRTL